MEPMFGSFSLGENNIGEEDFYANFDCRRR